MQSPEGTTYEKRTDAGKTVTEFNAHLRKELAKDFPVVDDDATNDSSQSVVFDIPFPDRNISSSSNFSYMYTPLYQRAVALDEHITDYEKCVKEKLGIANLQAVGDPSPAQVTVVGRIICEAAEGKLNPSVVQLEGSRKTCGGQRVLLDLSAVPNFQVFPGKV
jgi:DNA polymerase alpha subunit B